MEQLAKMGDELKSLAERQEKMVERHADYETLRAETRRVSSPSPSGPASATWAASRTASRTRSAELAEKLEGAPVFALTLKRAGRGDGRRGRSVC